MRKYSLILAAGLLLAACAPQKPPLDATQMVDGRSIVIPPEFDVVPEKQS